MRSLLLFTALTLTLSAKSQNIGINTTGALPAASAMLDISATDRGVLVPRIALTATNVAAPVTAPAASLLVYNTNTAGAGATAVSPGYYYWNGTVWLRIATDGDYWKIVGNGGTTPSNTGIGTAANNNFIGTTDATDFVIATNNMERLRIKTDNATQLRIGAGTAFTTNLIAGSTPTLLHLHDWGNTANDFAVINLSTASTTSGHRTGVLNFAATLATNERRSAAIESYMTAASATNVTGDMRFFTNDNNAYGERMRIMANGRVGVNTTAPVGQFEVVQTTATPVGVFTNNGATNNIWLRRSQGTPAAPTLIGSGGVLGRFFAMGYDGAAYQNAAAISFEVDAGSGAGDMPGRIVFLTTPDGSTAVAERMRIDNAGNVRINNTAIPTTNPAFADNPFIRLSATGGFAYFGNFNCDPAGLGNNGRPGHNFLNGVGALAIGVNRAAGTSGIDFWNTTSNGMVAANGVNDRGFYFRNYNTASNEALIVYFDGDGDVYAQSYNVVSDERTKKNFGAYPNVLEKVMQVKTYEYTLLSRHFDDDGNLVFTDEASFRDMGFKAQELYELFPELVKKPENEKKKTWSVSYDKMVVILTKAIQEQQQIIDDQKKELDLMRLQMHEELKKQQAQLDEITRELGKK